MHPHDPYAAYAPPSPAPHGYPGTHPGSHSGSAPLYRQNVFVPPGASTAPLLGRGLRNGKLGVGIAYLVAAFIGFGLFMAGALMGQDGGGALMVVGGGFLFLSYMLVMVWGILGLVWIHKFWSWIPPEQRYTPMWKKYISPGAAACFMLIPYFNFYWMFVINLGIADILERMRVAYPTDKPPAKTIALINTIVAIVFFPAAPFLDYFYDKHVEGMAADMQARMHSPMS